MAYLHCHSCDWSQDDFWTKTYNPFTKFWNDIKWLAKPRLIDLYDWIIHDIGEYTGVPIWKKQKTRTSYTVFSWNWLLVEFIKEIKIARRQKWWTWKSWEKDKDTAVCPKCGNKNFDID